MNKSLFSLALLTLSASATPVLYKYVDGANTIYVQSCCGCDGSAAVTVNGQTGSVITGSVVTSNSVTGNSVTGNSVTGNTVTGNSVTDVVTGNSGTNFIDTSNLIHVVTEYLTSISVGVFTTTLFPGINQVVSTITTTATELIPITFTTTGNAAVGTPTNTVVGVPVTQTTVIGGVTTVVTIPGTNSISTEVLGGTTTVVTATSNIATVTGGGGVGGVPFTVTTLSNTAIATTIGVGVGVGGINSIVTSIIGGLPTTIDLGITTITAPTVTLPTVVTVPDLGFDTTSIVIPPISVPGGGITIVGPTLGVTLTGTTSATVNLPVVTIVA